MGESDGVVYWKERERDGYGDILSSDDFSYFQSVNQSVDDDDDDDQESGSKRIRLSPDFNHQEGDVESCAESSPLGLTLRKTPSFLSLLENSLSKGKEEAVDNFSTRVNINQDSQLRTKIDQDLGSQSMSEKLKASNFPAFFIRIGTWQRISRHEGDLIAKLYYAKRKMVWEVLDGALKSKIEIQWSDIIAIRASTPENLPGTLEIELNQPPLFYRETNPQPRKHTLWQQASDFTGGQAPVWRRHCVKFGPGILDKHYEKLLQYDQRLYALSLKPFPSQDSPFFDSSIFGISPFSLSFNGSHGSRSFPPRVQHPYQNNCPTISMGAPHRFTSHSPVSAMDLSYRNQRGSNSLPNQNQTIWAQGANFLDGNFNYQCPIVDNKVWASHQHYALNDIANHLLSDSQVVCTNEGTFQGNVDSLCTHMEPVGMNNYQITPESDQLMMMQRTSSIHQHSVGEDFMHNNWLPSNESMEVEPIMSTNSMMIPPYDVASSQAISGGFYQI